jgi:hypothetical protein
MQFSTVSVEIVLKSRVQHGRAARDPERFSGLHHLCATVICSSLLLMDTEVPKGGNQARTSRQV